MSQQESEEQSDRRKYEFRKVIEELQEHEGSGTQLVTIYVPPDRQISDVVAHVTQEHSEASNIKSKQTRTNVQDALTSIKDRLKYYDTTPPENGMVLFSGAVDSGRRWFRGSARGVPCGDDSRPSGDGQRREPREIEGL